MVFKLPELLSQFEAAPLKLQEVAFYFASLSERLGVEAVVTRIRESIPGSSGVHEAGRAIDFRDQHFIGGKLIRLYTEEDVQYLTAEMNSIFTRNDGLLVCIHHSFKGGPLHFHCQIPALWT